MHKARFAQDIKAIHKPQMKVAGRLIKTAVIRECACGRKIIRVFRVVSGNGQVKRLPVFFFIFFIPNSLS